MEKYLNTINKVGEFVHNNSDFCKSLELSFPIPDQTNNNKNLVGWYPASGGDFTLLEQDLYLPIEGKMEEVKTFIYVDKQYYFVKCDESGLYSVIYGHNGRLCTGVLGKYLGFKCVLHVSEDKVCMFINADIRTFESSVIKNNVRIDLVCFVPYGVSSDEGPSRLTAMRTSFFLGEFPQEKNQDYSLEKNYPEMTYLMSSGGPYSYFLNKVIPVQTTPINLTKADKIKALKSLTEFSLGETLIEIESDVFELFDIRMQAYNGKTIQEALLSLQMGVKQSKDKFLIIDYEN